MESNCEHTRRLAPADTWVKVVLSDLSESLCNQTTILRFRWGDLDRVILPNLTALGLFSRGAQRTEPLCPSLAYISAQD